MQTVMKIMMTVTKTAIIRHMFDKTPKYRAEVNPDGTHWMIDNEEKYTLEYWKDLRNSQCLNIVISWKSGYDDPPRHTILPERDWVETKGKPGATFVEKYDPDSDSLIWEWKRSALVMWPKEKHCEVVVDLFGWKVARLVQDVVHFPGENGLAERIKIAENFLGRSREQMGLVNSIKPKNCRLDFLAFTQDIHRQDLFISTLDKFGVPENLEDLEVIKRALGTFSDDLDFADRVVSMCVDAKPAMLNKMRILVYFFGKEAQEITKFIRQSFADAPISASFSPEALGSLSQEVGDNLFRNEYELPILSLGDSLTMVVLQGTLESRNLREDRLLASVVRILGERSRWFKDISLTGG